MSAEDESAKSAKSTTPVPRACYTDARGRHRVDFQGPNLVHLRQAIQGMEGGPLKVLELQPLTAKAMRALPATNQTVGNSIDIAGEMAGQPPFVMDQLRAEDLGSVMEVANAFLALFQGTGVSG